MRWERRGVSTSVMVVALVAVLAVAGGGYYAYSALNGGGSTTSLSETSTTPSSLTAQGGTRVIFELHPEAPLVSSDVVANYTLDVIILGTLEGPLNFTSTAPQGIAVSFAPNELQPGDSSGQVSVSFRVASSVGEGNAPFNVTAQSGGQKFSEEFLVKVVRYLVVTVGTSFIPGTVNVQVGATVYWIRLNGAIDQYDNGAHNVSFGSLGVTSPTLAQFDVFSYVFETPGTYNYDCTFHASMDGQVVVA